MVLTTSTLLNVIPGLLTASVAPAVKEVPVTTNIPFEPGRLLTRFRLNNVGGGKTIVNKTGLLVAPPLVTVRLMVSFVVIRHNWTLTLTAHRSRGCLK